MGDDEKTSFGTINLLRILFRHTRGVHVFDDGKNEV